VKAKVFISQKVYFYNCIRFNIILIINGSVYFRDLTSQPADQVPPVKRGPSVEKLVASFRSCIVLKFLSFFMDRERFPDRTDTLAHNS
jgi:hypothetical protein